LAKTEPAAAVLKSTGATMTATNDKIIEVVALMRQVDQSENADDANELGDELSQLDGEDQLMLQIAYKVLSGKSYTIKSGSLGTIDRCRSLANDLGATVVNGSTAASRVIDYLLGRSGSALMSITILPPKGSA
jgi:hypothetical protein